MRRSHATGSLCWELRKHTERKAFGGHVGYKGQPCGVKPLLASCNFQVLKQVWFAKDSTPPPSQRPSLFKIPGRSQMYSPET